MSKRSEWNDPCYQTSNGQYRRWDLPSQAWSGSEFHEDNIKVGHDTETGEWWACTECDQCVKRDLDSDEIKALISELNLEPA